MEMASIAKPWMSSQGIELHPPLFFINGVLLAPLEKKTATNECVSWRVPCKAKKREKQEKKEEC